MLRLAFIAGNEAPFDLLEQEINKIFDICTSSLMCPHCGRRLNQHRHLGDAVFWSCTCSSKPIASRSKSDEVRCPDCNGKMETHLAESGFNLRILLWECADCNRKVKTRLCPNCFSLMSRRENRLNNFSPFADLHWYTCFVCGKTFEYDN